MLFGVQHFVRHTGFFKNFRNRFRFFDGNRSNQNRLAALVKMLDAMRITVVFLQNAIDYGLKFLTFGTVNNIWIFDADQRPICGDDNDIQFIYLVEFGSFGFRCTGHTGKFFVHAKIILKRNRGESLVLSLDLDAFFGFDGLMQSVRPAPPGHLPSGEFVDNDHFAVFHYVIDVTLVERARAQSLIYVMNQLHMSRIV